MSTSTQTSKFHFKLNHSRSTLLMEISPMKWLANSLKERRSIEHSSEPREIQSTLQQETSKAPRQDQKMKKEEVYRWQVIKIWVGIALVKLNHLMSQLWSS